MRALLEAGSRLRRHIGWRIATACAVHAWRRAMVPWLPTAAHRHRFRLCTLAAGTRALGVRVPVPHARLRLQDLDVRLSVRDHYELASVIEILAEGAYEWPSADGIEYIVDAGANVGVASLVMHALYPRASIVALEPMPDTYHRLARNLSGVARARTWELAVGVPGKQAFADNAPSTERSSGGLGSRAAVTYVESVSLSSVLDELEWPRCDLLKVDVEGAEWDIFEDGEAMSRVRGIVGEAHARGSFRSVAEALPDFDVEETPTDEAWRFTARRRDSSA